MDMNFSQLFHYERDGYLSEVLHWGSGEGSHGLCGNCHGDS